MKKIKMRPKQFLILIKIWFCMFFETLWLKSLEFFFRKAIKLNWKFILYVCWDAEKEQCKNPGGVMPSQKGCDFQPRKVWCLLKKKVYYLSLPFKYHDFIFFDFWSIVCDFVNLIMNKKIHYIDVFLCEYVVSNSTKIEKRFFKRN